MGGNSKTADGLPFSAKVMQGTFGKINVTSKVID